GFQLARSRDGGTTWEPLNTPTGRYVTSMRTDPTNAARLYLALEREGFFQSNDRGQSWQPITNTVPDGLADAVAVAPDGTVYIGFITRPGVYARPPAGPGWSLVAGAPAEAVLFLSWQPDCQAGGAACLLVGTTKGLWRLNS